MGKMKKTRRDFLKAVGAGAAGLAGTSVLPGAATLPGPARAWSRGADDRPQGADRPNIVLVMADDMGFSDIGCYGGEIQTPNLDRLAGEGMRFTQFYNAARCCPTRASLLTGRSPHQAGLGHMTSENDYTLKRNKQIGHASYQGYLNTSSVTIAEALRQSGYQTFMTGKWHVGTYRPHWPTDRGFERYFGIVRGASDYFNPDVREKRLLLDDELFLDLPPDFYTTDYFSTYAAQFIEEADQERPFFLYTAYTAPHWPLHAWPQDIAKYEGRYLEGWDVLRQQRFGRQQEMGLFGDEVQLSPRAPESRPWEETENKRDWDRRMAVYAAMVDRMDQGIGRILEALEASGQAENTLFLFLSDNGGCAEHYNPVSGIWPGPPNSATAYYLPWANASNTPFRLYKHWVHEGGIATPLIAHWPGQIGEGAVTSEPGHVMDVMATCLDVAGAEYPQTYRGYDIEPLEGRSLAPVLRRSGEHEGHERIFWEHEGNRAVREGPWKLVSYYSEERVYGVGNGARTGDWQLYNLAEDRTELNDLSEAHPEKRAELEAAYAAWAARTGVLDWEEVQRRLGNVE